MGNPRVFIPQEPAKKVDGEWVRLFDLTPAAHFGVLTPLTHSPVSLMFPVPIVRELRNKLESFSDSDYVLAIGDPTLLALTAMIAGERNRGRVKLLKWDRRQGLYIPVQIDTSGRAI